MRPPQFTKRRMMMVGAVIGVAVATCWMVVSYFSRDLLRGEAAYNVQMRSLNLGYEVRIRGEIDRLLGSKANEQNGRETTDHVFEMLRLSRVAANSREVTSWEAAPHSPERMAVALKWAKVAADEAAFEAALHERWGRDYDLGRMPHHITNDEIPPFRMPAGWTEDDLKYGQGKRNE
jgi:hypothetical protein